MRTVRAPLHPRVQEQIDGLDRKRCEIATRYIRRLALDPQLGHRLTRGPFGSEDARAVYFDNDSHPEDLFGEVRMVRKGNEDLSEGPKYRVVYRLLEARAAGVMVIQVLAVGRAHIKEDCVYTKAEALLHKLNRKEQG